MRRPMKRHTALLLAFCLAAAGCVAIASCATHFENSQLPSGHHNAERRIYTVHRSDQPVILVAISGGGSRAAALGWAVLEKLKRTTYTVDGQSRRLIDDVAVVSSVSGGSVIAGYFGLNGADQLDAFEGAFLRPDNMHALEMRALNPFTWIRLKFTGHSRIKLLQELLDREVYGGKTFAAMNQAGKPFVVLNSTDMVSGEVFSFLPSRFDDICTDFDAESLSTGVSASGAFPILLTPVALENYSTKPDCTPGPMPSWITEDLDKQYARYINIEEFKRARYAYDLRQGDNASSHVDHVHPEDGSTHIDYVYLLDGGLADNLGVNALMDVIDSTHGSAIIAGGKAGGASETILKAINVGDISRLAVIVVNARTDPSNPISLKPSRPGLVGMIKSATSVPIDSSTARGEEQVRTLLGELQQAPIGGAAGIRIYNIQVDFDLFRTQDAEEKQLSDAVKKIATSFSISSDELNTLERSAEVLLKDSPCFQRLLLDAGVTQSDAMAKYAATGCPQPADSP
jgi:NTE family protein